MRSKSSRNFQLLRTADQHFHPFFTTNVAEYFGQTLFTCKALSQKHYNLLSSSHLHSYETTNHFLSTTSYLRTMASLTPEEKIEFLLVVLADAEEFRPNYAAVARKLAINTPQNAQRRFKSIVEAGNKYSLQSSKDHVRVVAKDGNDAQPVTPAKITKATKSKTPKSNKRANSDDGNEEEGSETPTNKAKKSTKKVAAIKEEAVAEEEEADATVELAGEDEV